MPRATSQPLRSSWALRECLVRSVRSRQLDIIFGLGCQDGELNHVKNHVKFSDLRLKPGDNYDNRRPNLNQQLVRRCTIAYRRWLKELGVTYGVC